MKTFLADLRHAWRLLVKAPGASLIAVLTIALGMGINATIFSLVDASLLRPAFSEPERLVAIGDRFPDLQNGPVSFPDFVEWRHQTQAFESMAAYFLDHVSLFQQREPQRIAASRVSEGYFRLLDVRARAGRLFSPEDHREGAPRVCLISEVLWRRKFQGRPNIIGETLFIDRIPYSIVGALPGTAPSLSYPEKTEVWIPLEPTAPFKERGTNYLDVVGRLKPGVALARARTELETIQDRINAEFPDNRHGVSLRPLSEALFGGTAPVLLALFVAAGVVVLIGCANLANLLLARGAERSREFAIRLALGAQRKRILRQLLTEGLVIVSLGGAVGTLLAMFSANFLIALAPRAMRLPERIHPDWRLCLFALGLIALVAVISGVVPAIRASAVEINEVLRAGSHQMTASSRRLGARQRFVIAEIALATVLLAGALLTMESLWRLVHTDPGFVSENVLAIELSLPASQYPSDVKRMQFFGQLLERLRAMPGVVAAGAITDLPIGQGGTTGDFVIEGREPASPADRVFVTKEIVTPGYFEAMRVPLIAGRLFNEHDRAAGSKVVIISRSMARRFWPGQDPIGRRLDLGLGDRAEWQEIIGVVGDVKSAGLDAQAAETGYLCSTQYPALAMTILLHAAQDPLSLAGAARSAVLAVDSQVPVSNLTTMDAVLWQSLSQPRALAWLLSVFATIALLLAAIGVYGLTAQFVAGMTAEIGIRVALGANRGQVLRSILGTGLKLAMIGLVAGLVIAAGSVQLLRHLLYGISTLDPLAFAAAPLVLGSSALLACYLPARRAASIDPMRALRNG